MIDKGKDKSTPKEDHRKVFSSCLWSLTLWGQEIQKTYIFPDLKKVRVTINGSPNILYNNGIESQDIWKEISRFFMKEKHKPQYMTLQKFYTDNKFWPLIDLRTMASHEMHGSSTHLVNSTDGVHVEIERDGKGSRKGNCHVFVISASQFSILEKQLYSVTY